MSGPLEASRDDPLEDEPPIFDANAHLIFEEDYSYYPRPGYLKEKSISANDIEDHKISLGTLPTESLGKARESFELIKSCGHEIIYFGHPALLPDITELNAFERSQQKLNVVVIKKSCLDSGRPHDFLGGEKALPLLYHTLSRHDLVRLLDAPLRLVFKDIPYGADSMVTILRHQQQSAVLNPSLGSKPMVVFSVIPIGIHQALCHACALGEVYGHSELFSTLQISGDQGIRGTFTNLDDDSPLILKIPIGDKAKNYFYNGQASSGSVFAEGLILTARLLLEGGISPLKKVLTDSLENEEIRQRKYSIKPRTTLGELARGAVHEVESVSAVRAPELPIESERSVKVKNREGIHARPSKLIADLALRFEAEIQITNGEHSADARSCLELALLDASCGTVLTVAAKGRDALEALSQIVKLIGSGFLSSAE